MLDKYEDVAPVGCVADLTDTHGAFLFREGVSADHVNLFLQGVNPAREAQGLYKLSWPKNARSGTKKNSEVPSLEQVRPIYFELKHRVFSLFRRWEEADALAKCGVNWASSFARGERVQLSEISDLHATYRGIAAVTRYPCPSITETIAFTGAHQDSPFVNQFFSFPFGLFPSPQDVRDVLMLFLLKAGWNGATALNLDVTKEEKWFRRHPVSPGLHVVFSIKEKGTTHTEQVAIGDDKSQLSPGNLIKAIVARTEPLRAYLRSELKSLLSAQRTAEVSARIAEIHRLLRSPWLFVSSRSHNKIDALTLENYKLATNQKSAVLRPLIQEINKKRSAKDKVPESITLKQFRDVWISFAYSQSGYSWLIGVLAAGHASVGTLRRYLARLRWKMHGQQVTKKFLDSFWKLVEERRIVDGAILYAMVQRGEVTEEQVERWLAHKDRTRAGTGCKDFTHPPAEIAPDHVEGTGCRIQRCTLCEHAVVFDDTLDPLTMRLVELEHLKSTMALTAWYSSSFPLEMIATRDVLTLFDSNVVKQRLQFWRDEITAGRHKPFMFEGEYGTQS
ncbi:hypothetical protein [Paraburkholderia phenoliruptrix]|uniref:hypothetical protein n=1 Tax=Paraburkholderia phenoliruptrix TaxID=252970 RepID=UPI002869B252|nr:hypothetical protein [Paraburkholderia phenoliruptrix]WMY07297.1 hypothetical protein P3F88_13560 [Paraburkholderia phenoliruptrix]